MKVDLSPDQEAFIRQAIKDGRVESTEDAVRTAMRLWEERERCRAEILSAIASSEASVNDGLGLEMTEESLHELTRGVKQRGRNRLSKSR